MNKISGKIKSIDPLYWKLGIGLLVGSLFYKKIKDLLFPDTSQAVENAGNEINNNELSYTTTQYETFADRIEAAEYNGGWPGTDEEAIYDVFTQMNTYSDVMALIVAYGKRRYWGNWIPATVDMVQLLYEELTEKELEKINEILRAKGINYQL